MNGADRALVIVGCLALILVLLFGAPLALIWSLNTLFALGIPTTWATFFAALVLLLVVGGRTSRKGRES